MLADERYPEVAGETEKVRTLDREVVCFFYLSNFLTKSFSLALPSNVTVQHSDQITAKM